jgi:hypothetical protein
MTPNYRLLAAQKFIGANIYGTGRWAVVACNKKAVWLTTTEQSAHAAALGSCHQVTLCQANHGIFDLQPCPTAPRCKDRDYSDRAERRKYGA